MEGLNDQIEDVDTLCARFIERDGFKFTCVYKQANVYNGIVIKASSNVRSLSFQYGENKKKINEYIEVIAENNIEKAVILAENIEFLLECPSLKYIKIIPSDTCLSEFDFSPIYLMKDLRYLEFRERYGEFEEHISQIDFAKLKALKMLNLTVTSGTVNYAQISALEELSIMNYPGTNLRDMFSSKNLRDLEIVQSKIKDLSGIETTKELTSLSLCYNRSLDDISQLEQEKDSLRILSILNCPKIKDFSVLEKLEKLEGLELYGSNRLADLHFLKNLKNLKLFSFNMNVLDGDLSLCMRIPYVYSERNRKHYNLKNSELPKQQC